MITTAPSTPVTLVVRPDGAPPNQVGELRAWAGEIDSVWHLAARYFIDPVSGLEGLAKFAVHVGGVSRNFRDGYRDPLWHEGPDGDLLLSIIEVVSIDAVVPEPSDFLEQPTRTCSSHRPGVRRFGGR